MITIVPLSILSYLMIGPVTAKFLPNYIGGINAAKASSLGCIFLAYFGSSIIIPVVRRNIPMMVGYAIAIVLLWIIGLIAIQKGYGIEGVAWARFTASAFLCAFALIYSYYLTTLEIKA